MNNIKRIVVSFAVLLIVQANAIAADKIGVVDVQGIFQALPQAAAIQQNIAAEFKEQMEVIQMLERNIQYNMDKLKREAVTMSEQEVKALKEQTIKLRQDYAAKAQPLQNDMQRRASEERNKLLSLIQASISRIATAEKYDIVLNAGAVTFITDARDISQKVINDISKTR